jgi:hypothetical protein
MHRSVALVLFFCSACASAPSAFSSRSAASPESAAAPRVTIGRALTEEPPAPGAASEGWVGLAGSAAEPGSEMHHHHHPGMVMPGPTTETPDAQ